MTKQPVLTGFSHAIFATAKRRAQAAIRALRKSLINDSLSGYALIFESVLPAAFLSKIDPTNRDRHFGHLPIFWAWLGQILEGNASCTKGLSMIQSWCRILRLPVPASDTSGYCRARTRTKDSFLENQLAYPQHSNSKEGFGFPIMGIVGMVNLSHGGVEGFKTCGFQKHDARIAPNLLRVTMQEAAQKAGKKVHEMSVRATPYSLTSSHETFRGVTGKPLLKKRLYDQLLDTCAEHQLEIRPFRQEPRAIKRRPKNYQLLTAHCRVFKEVQHRATCSRKKSPKKA